MRPVPVFTYSTVSTAFAPPPSTSAIENGLNPHSTWHSPVPYLFGGIAAMMGTIALALLILACSYWKLSGDFDDSENANGEPRADGEAEKGSGGSDVGRVVLQTIHVAVIMAGQEKPTFLATPVEKKNDDQGSVSESKKEENENDNDENLRVEMEERGMHENENSPDESV